MNINMNTSTSTDVTVKSKRPDSCCFVLFGVTGDLARRLVIPALYNLAEADLLPENFCVITAKSRSTPSSWLDEVRSFSGQSGQVSGLFSCAGGCGRLSS